MHSCLVSQRSLACCILSRQRVAAAPAVHRPLCRVRSGSSRRPFAPRASEGATAVAETQSSQPISLTDRALNHLKRLRAEVEGSNLLLRVGVKQGGCSGMSYKMDFEQAENIKEDDYVISYDSEDFKLVIDPKSLLYLFGMRLDYSDALIGGGFQFNNPNATDTCGCGKSFGV
eukprot:jgi/Chrzof1/13704/Cz08g08230.t1_ISC1[v5.2]